MLSSSSITIARVFQARLPSTFNFANSKIVASKKASTKEGPRYYNEIFSIESGEILAKFGFFGPIYDKREDKLLIKVLKPFTFRVIPREQAFQKGSTYLMWDFSMRQLKDFASTNYKKGEVFKVQYPNSLFKIELKEKEKNEQKVNQTNQNMASSDHFLNFHIRKDNQEHQFQMKQSDFSKLQMLIQSSYLTISGAEACFNFELQEKLQMFFSNQLKQEEDNFNENQVFVL